MVYNNYRVENILYLIQFICIEHYNKARTELLGTQKWPSSSLSEKEVTHAMSGLASTWVGRRGSRKHPSRGDLWTGSWNMRNFFPDNYTGEEEITNKNIGAGACLGKPRIWLAHCCSGVPGRYSAELLITAEGWTGKGRREFKAFRKAFLRCHLFFC